MIDDNSINFFGALGFCLYGTSGTNPTVPVTFLAILVFKISSESDQRVCLYDKGYVSCMALKGSLENVVAEILLGADGCLM